jgi:hypothetical protein
MRHGSKKGDIFQPELLDDSAEKLHRRLHRRVKLLVLLKRRVN